jgi:hypothetical protein
MQTVDLPFFINVQKQALSKGKRQVLKKQMAEKSFYIVLVIALATSAIKAIF